MSSTIAPPRRRIESSKADEIECSGELIARVGDVELCYETMGTRDGRPLVLIMGLASQMILWPDVLCRALVERGHFVIRFDNRDVGRSTHLTAAGKPSLVAAAIRRGLGLEVDAPYTLDHMADDVDGLMTHLGLERAHVCGASLGGMVAQTLAIRHPERALSLTSIMSSTGKKRRHPKLQAARAMLRRGRVRSREQYADELVALFEIIGSPGYPFDEAFFRAYAIRAWERGLSAAGIVRQLVAVIAHGDRATRLAKLLVPALVIHGDRDPMIPVAGGRDVARAIPGAEMILYDGMGHDLPRALWPEIADAITRHTRDAEAARES